MAEKPYKIIDRRGTSRTFYGNNQLIKAATQTSDRKATPFLDYDTNRNISHVGHRTLRNVGRFIFANFPMVHGALQEQAELSVGTFIPQYLGADKAWGEMAEQALVDWHRILDLRGWPYDGTSFLTNLIIGARRDGDHATLLTENADGYPLIQTIPVHRIGSRYNEFIVSEGEYDGATIINGVIVNEYGTPLAYRVYDDYPYTGEHTDIPADSLILSYFPEWVDQSRGITSMGSCAFDWSDIAERRSFEMLAQKYGSALNLIETNERGGPTPGAQFITRPTTGSNTTGTPTGLITESYDGGTVRYLKANSGSKIEGFRNDRPSADSQRFEESMIRGAFAGMEWSIDFALDPTKAGGAQMRIVVEKINATIAKNQRLAAKVMRRLDGWALRKFIKIGLLPENVDWYKWAFQGPAEVTADAKYDSDVTLQEIRSGIDTRQRACARRGEFWQDVDDQRETETDAMLGRAQKLAKKYNLQIQEVITLLNLPTPNGNLAAVNIQEPNVTDGQPGKTPDNATPANHE
ncbi:MAG: hypothetical protein JWQ04_1125 [Pedosphaera sp.]|nr:hypothetical protein [Pedosphaera sp.]